MKNRSANIDLLKGIAIISVIILHSISSSSDLQKIGASFYIWQAVPIFIILASYNSVCSYIRSGFNQISHGYQRNIIRRFERLLVPYILVWGFEIIIAIATKHFQVKSLLDFGFGPGGYFVPVIVQQTLILPFMYWLAQRSIKAMLLVAFITDIFLEVLLYKLGLPSSIYRILYVRYLFAGALGIWLAVAKKKINVWVVTGTIMSLIYIICVNYFGFKLPIDPSWGSQNAPSFIYPLTIVMIGLAYLPERVESVPGITLQKIGQASYHIFLTQMVYFWIKQALSFGKYLSSIPSLIVNIVVCVLLGMMFERLESNIRFIHLNKSAKSN